MIALKEIKEWRLASWGPDVEVLTEDGWTLYSTAPHVEDDLAELRAAGVPESPQAEAMES